MALALVVAVAATACAHAPPPPPHVPVPPPTSAWGDKFAFSWSPPAASGKPLPLTIAVVAPDFSGKDCTLSDQSKDYRKLVQGLSHSFAVDLDQALVAKGARVIGPFDSFGELTYAEKKGADLALTPIVCARNVSVKYGPLRPIGGEGVTDWFEKPFELEMEIEIVLVMKEPLSEQKLWVKKLSLPPASERGVEAYGTVPRMGMVHLRATAFENPRDELRPVGFDPSPDVIFDGKQDAIASLFKVAYPTIMAKAWTYLDAEEMEHMKPTVDEIRKKSTVIQR